MSSPAAAQRVAGAISVVKWVVIAFQLLAAFVFGFGAVLASSDDFVSTPAGLVGAVVIALSAVVTWVLFGWFEHTLSMLAQVAINTAPAAAPYSPAL